MIATTPDRDVGDIGRPHLVRPVDPQAAQQIRESLVLRRRLAGPRLRAGRRNSHPAHQPPHALAVDGMSFRPQHCRHPPRAEERPSREQLVDPPHQRQIVVIVGRRRRSIDAGAGNAEQHALPADRQLGMIAVHERTTVRALIFRTSWLKNRAR